MTLSFTLVLLATAFLSIALSDAVDTSTDPATKACQLLANAFPQLVAFPGSEQYSSDIAHWAFTSTQNATCTIEPETAHDVGEILKIIGRSDIMSPFAVKSGGHAYNVGHSSTTGVQISMAKFTGLDYDPGSGTVTIGTGFLWDEVYSRLEPFGVMVNGGRVPGVGVAGLSLGGGYSWKTNQFGLGIDTIVSHSVVLPSGEQGGLNNFGIVTNITFEAHPQTLVYGGQITYASNVSNVVNAATSDFSANNKDPKAQIISSLGSASGELVAVVLFFYDGPTLPSGIFDAFFSIPFTSSDISTRTFVDLFGTFGNTTVGSGPMGNVGHVVPVTDYPVDLLNHIAEEVIVLEGRLTRANDGLPVVVAVSAEPFLNAFSHSRGGAYPHPSSRQVTPMAISVLYEINLNSTQDEQSGFHEMVVSSVKELSNLIQAEAVSLGVSRWDDILYPNYALDGTSLELMYGSNVQTLREIAAKYDPDGIMKLTGGPHF
ncbi:FAD-binding domain-containing protein [Sanghuangporus baumii]|uniref:FAD-binding domain-containing protein n=1 Tax=Sanghuangporus baumii TaxID=108892 RepID=A0A9Q5NBY6_SANBA|nr:FAD-binding domain-containing protein [Sanghuangporus baumii]